MARVSNRVADLTASPIRAILEVAGRPDVVSFAGGLPSPDSFDDIAFEPPAAKYWQYGPTEGEPELRALIAAELRALGVDAVAERVLILSGSQQGIDLVAKLFIDRGTPVAVESPAYLAALQAYRFFGADFQPMVRGDDRPWGTTPSSLSRAPPPALAYVTPTFQNPTGHCWSARDRDALARACDEEDVTLFEDDPYRELAYDPCDRTPICAGVRRAAWVYQGSFSKTLAPGLRLGFLTASEDLFTSLVRLKQAADLHSSRISQALVLQHLADPGRADRMTRLVGRYRAKRDAFDDAMRRHLGDLATWETPPGGLFFWASLNIPTDTGELLRRALDRKVAFMPGEPFMIAPDPARSTLRLNFSHADAEAANRGLAILAELLREAPAPAPDQAASTRMISASAKAAMVT